MKNIFLISLLLTLVISCNGSKSKHMGFDKLKHENFSELKLGDSLESVKLKLGEPKQKDQQLNLPQKQGVEELFQDSTKSKSTIYYLWMNGGNWYYSIGFDEKNKLTFKAEGNS